MTFEREWLSSIALNLVDSYNYSTRRALDKILDNLGIKSYEIRATTNALLIETIRRKNIIDRLANYVLDKTFQNQDSSYPSLKKLDAKVKNLLRIMIYRLKFENHQPELVLNTSRQILLEKYSRFIDVFTSWLTLLIDIEVEYIISTSDDFIDQIALQTWEPYFLVKRFQEVYGENAIQILEYFKSNSPLFIRINKLKNDIITFNEFKEFNVSLEKDKYFNDVYKVLKSDVPMARLEGFKNGFFYIQSRSSSMISYFLDPKEGEVILDACSAPGSKTTHIASLTNNKSILIALEIDINRSKTLKQTLNRCGVESVEIVTGDARDQIFESNKRFDKILLDAPCSGSGTLSTKPHAKWRIKNSLIKKYAQLQFEIISNISKYLKKDGILLYSTCSLLPEENEDVIEKFLDNNKSFESIDLLYPEIGREISFKGKRLIPHEVDSEGFSVFLLKRHS